MLSWQGLSWPGLACGPLVGDNGLTGSLLTVSGLIPQVIGREEQPRQAGQRARLLVRLAGFVARARFIAKARFIARPGVLDLAGDAPLIGVAGFWRVVVGGQCHSSVVLCCFLR
jgi:hypothetical protein